MAPWGLAPRGAAFEEDDAILTNMGAPTSQTAITSRGAASIGIRIDFDLLTQSKRTWKILKIILHLSKDYYEMPNQRNS